MKIAVTGGSGRIGSEVARQLRERGHQVLTLDIRPPADTKLPHKVVDLRVESAVRRAFDGLDAVCHLGEYPNIYGGPAETFAHNTETGSTVMSIAKQVGVGRVIYTSTCQIYGYWGCNIMHQPAPPSLPISEATPRRATNAYALSKIANELFAELLTAEGSIDIAAFRFPFVIAAARAEWMLNDRRKLAEGVPEGFGTYLIGEDAALAYCLALEKGWKGFEAFHFVADDIRSGEGMYDRLRQIWPATTLPGDWSETRPPVTTTKALEHFGWKPSHSQQTLHTLFPAAAARYAKTA